MNQPQWSRVFRRSTIRPDAWVLINSRTIWRKPHQQWEAIEALCRTLDVPGLDEGRDRKGWALLDGGVFMRAGNYCTGRRGVWVVGSMVLRFLCARLGIVPPQRIQNENNPASPIELEWCLRAQIHEGQDALELQLLDLGSHFDN